MFLEEAIRDQVTFMSLQVQHTHGVEEFLHRHPGLRRLTIALDLILPLEEDCRAQMMMVLLKDHLNNEDATSITRVTYKEAIRGGKFARLLTSVLRRVDRLLGDNTDT